MRSCIGSFLIVVMVAAACGCGLLHPGAGSVAVTIVPGARRPAGPAAPRAGLLSSRPGGPFNGRSWKRPRRPCLLWPGRYRPERLDPARF